MCLGGVVWCLDRETSSGEESSIGSGAHTQGKGEVRPTQHAPLPQGGFKASSDAEASAAMRGTQLSVGNALRGALCGILRSRQPSR